MNLHDFGLFLYFLGVVVWYTGDKMLPYCIGWVTIFCVGLVQNYNMVKHEMQYGNLLFGLFVT